MTGHNWWQLSFELLHYKKTNVVVSVIMGYSYHGVIEVHINKVAKEDSHRATTPFLLLAGLVVGNVKDT